MDKRMVANAKVKRNIQDALFLLMKKKNFSEITVTDIITEANVARASYYRNFDSKEEIITSYIDRIHNEVSDLIPPYEIITASDENTMLNAFTTNLRFYKDHADYLLLLYDNGFGTLVLEEINQFAEVIDGDMKIHSPERYRLYFLSGAMFNMLMHWLKEDRAQPPEEMAKIFVNYFMQIK